VNHTPNRKHQKDKNNREKIVVIRILEMFQFLNLDKNHSVIIDALTNFLYN